MRNILILGAGTAGTIMANKLQKALNKKEWKIIIIDNDKTHYYQPGFLFIPFGSYAKKDVIKNKQKFLPRDVEYVDGEIDLVKPLEKEVLLSGGKKFSYDYLLIASGAKLAPEETPGLMDSLWNKDIFEFYTLDGALALRERLEKMEGGRLVVSMVDLPIKCPVAPIEFICLADAYFTKRKIRDKIELVLVTPLSGAFTKPKASKMLGNLLESKNIKVVPDFYIERVDNKVKKLISYDGKEIDFELLTIVPLNKGADFVGKSGLGDELNFIPVNKETFQLEKHPEIFVIGDAAAIPASKAGSVAHFAADVVLKNLLQVIKGNKADSKFDGHANCYIEAGFGKAALIDFNYVTEPLPGTYPLPYVGPFSLLKNSVINHWGKLLFRWIYWNILLKGRHLPVTNYMSMVGKKTS